MAANFAVSVSISAIDKVTRTINEITGNVSKQKDKLQSLTKTATDVTAGPRKFADSFKGLRQEVSGVNHSLEMKHLMSDIKSGTDKAVGSFKLLGSAAKDAFSVITRGGILIGALGFGSRTLFDEISKSNIELKHSAMQLNMSPDKLRAYRLTSESQGIPENAMTAALSRINDMAFQFQTNHEAPQSYGILNKLPGPAISYLDEHKRIRPSELILGEFLDKLQSSRIPKPAKVQFMNDFLSSSELMPLVAGGSKGLHAKAKEFQGADFKESDEATQKYLDANIKFDQSMRELKRIASIEILPGIAEGLKGITIWIKEHGKELRELFKDIGKGIPKEMNSALWWISGVVKGLTLLSKTVGIVNFFLGVTTIAMVFKVGKAIKNLIPSLETLSVWGGRLKDAWEGFGSLTAFAFDALLNPVTWIVAAIALVVGAFVYLGVVVYRNWDKIKEGWVKFKNNFTNGWHTLIADMKRSIHELSEPFSKLFQGKWSWSEFIDHFRINKPEPSTQGPPRLLERLSTPAPAAKLKAEQPVAQVNVRFDNLPKGARVESNASWVATHAGFIPMGVVS